MRILLLNQFFYPDSAATSQLLTDLARCLASQGHSVRVICGSSSYAEPDFLNPPAVEIIRTPDLPFGRSLLGRTVSYTSFLSGALCRGLLGPRPDLILTLTTPPALSVIGSLLKSVFRTRHFIWEMDLYPDIAVDLRVLRPKSMLTRTIRSTTDWSRRRSDGVIVLGEDMKARLIARGIPGHKIHVAENWADGREIIPIPFPSGPLVIHYSGNLGLAHDVETMMGALKQLGSDQRFRFVFAGDGARRDRMGSFCRDQNIRTVSFQPYSSRADLGKSLGTGHLGLVTQLPETCGSVVPSKTYGIMAAGRPLLYIGPSNGTPARIIEKHRCGWQIDPGDVPALMGLLERLSEDRALIRETGARGRKAFEQNYDRPIGVARIAAIFGLETTAPLSSQSAAGGL